MTIVESKEYWTSVRDVLNYSGLSIDPIGRLEDENIRMAKALNRIVRLDGHHGLMGQIADKVLKETENEMP